MMFVIEYLAVPALLLAIVHLFVPRKGLRWAAFVLVALILAAGAYGTWSGRARADRGAETDAQRDAGYAEANRPIQFAGLAASVLVVVLCAGILRRRRATRASDL